MRILIGMAAAFGMASALALEPMAPGTVRVIVAMSLDGPGALEALKATRPAHYLQAVTILRIASEMPCDELPRVVQAQFEAASLACRPSPIYTSWPAQRDVTFRLEDTLYSARVVLQEREELQALKRGR